MRKVAVLILIILAYNIFLLVVPILIFLSSLSLSTQVLNNAFFWIFLPFVAASPLLTIGCGYRIAKDKVVNVSWLTPFIISLAGFSPFWFLYLTLSSLWTPRDYFLVVSCPIILGLLANLAVLITDVVTKRR